MFVETKFFHKAGEGSGGGGGSDPHNKGSFLTPEALRTAYPTAEPGDFAIVESTDTVWVWDSDGSDWKDGDTKGQVTSVNGQTGAVTLTIPAAQVNSDWNASSGVAEILNKPTIPAAIQVSTMPTAAAGELGNIYQFVGTTDANYTNGYFYKCVSDGQTPATYSWTRIDVQPGGSSLPSQTGNAGKFLTTDGTDASWAVALKNNSTANATIAISGTSTYQYAVAVGSSAQAGQQHSVALGYYSFTSKDGAIAIGSSAESKGLYSVAIGKQCGASANYAIQLGGWGKSNSVANTFKVGNNNGNFEMMSADGTIPTDRFTTTPSADGTYVPTLTISSGTATRTWGAAASAPVVPATMPTLAVADWSSNTQTVNVTGVTASNIVFVSPAPASAADYAAAGIVCTAQGSGTLTFTCTTVPSNAITVNVVILG